MTEEAKKSGIPPEELAEDIAAETAAADSEADAEASEAVETEEAECSAEAAEESDEYRNRAEELMDRLDRFPDGKRASVMDRLAELRTGIVPMAGRRKEEMTL